MGGSSFKNPKVAESFQQSPFKSKKVEGGVWLVVANSLISDPLFLKSGHVQVMIFP